MNELTSSKRYFKYIVPIGAVLLTLITVETILQVFSQKEGLFVLRPNYVAHFDVDSIVIPGVYNASI